MAFTSSLVKKSVLGDLRVEIYSFTATGVTSGNITTGFAHILASALANKTEQRGTIDDTTTAGTAALTNLTAGDTGYLFVYSY